MKRKRESREFENIQEAEERLREAAEALSGPEEREELAETGQTESGAEEEPLQADEGDREEGDTPGEGLAKTGISGVANILPFTCLPGTIVASLSTAFRKDHEDMPWVDIAFDGQEDTGIETRLQAFVHQAKEYAKAKGYNYIKDNVSYLVTPVPG